MPFVDLATGARLHYIDTGGDNPPVILVHGMLGTAETHFSRVIEWLKPDYRVLGVTLRGYGESMPKPRGFPPNFYEQDARDVLAFMDALGIEKTHILGYSDGGETALLAAGLQPERFMSVVVWGAVGYFGPNMRPVVQRMYNAEVVTEADQRLHQIPEPKRFVSEWITSVKAMIDGGGNVSVQYAQNITCPLLLMLGDQDTLNPAEYGQNFVDKTANGRLVMFSCTHPVHDEVWGEFKMVVGGFLASVE